MDKLTVNEKIALILHKGSKLQLVPLSDITGQTMTCLNNSCRPILNYTGNWSDLMPLVVERGITLWNYSKERNQIKGEEFCAAELITQIEIFNENPQRALAECLLKVLQGE